MGTLVSFSSSFVAKLFSSPSSFSDLPLKPSSFCCVSPQMFFKRDSSEKKATSAAGGWCLSGQPFLACGFGDPFTSVAWWLQVSSHLAALGLGVASLCPQTQPSHLYLFQGSSSGLESGGVTTMSLCRCGEEKGSITLSGKWGHGGFAGGATTALVVAFSSLPSGPVAHSPDDI